MTCEKITFDSCSEAQRVINKAHNTRLFKNGQRIKRLTKRDRPKRAYKCEICGKWHLTSLKHDKYENK
jgi:hypothetical protein